MKKNTTPDNFPKLDLQFSDTTITKVDEAARGWGITQKDGWSFWIEKPSPITPKPKMRARFYGKGIGYTVRGLFLNGVKVFYRSAAEDEKYQSDQMYGKDAREWLARWDDGRGVWSIVMGGIGPGYEQAIQITAAEILRHLLAEKYDASAWMHKVAWENDRRKIETAGFANKRISELGLSGAQFGAALMLATSLYQYGPAGMLKQVACTSRHIQVSRVFPQSTN